MTAMREPAAARPRPVAPPEFYAGLTSRNAGIVSAVQQEALQSATVLVAGCGSVGGAAVQPLARLGVQRFLLADAGSYELNNLNRQHASVGDVGRNKAEVAAEHVLSINPHAEVAAYPEGVTADNVDELTATCQVVVDGVDVTTMSGLRAKFLLHQQAAARRLPLVTGWDMAGDLYAQVFDYRTLRTPFDGAITAQDLDHLDPWEVIFKMLPLRRIPTDMLRELGTNMNKPDYNVPQVTYAALLFGAVSAHLVAKLLAGEAVREEISIDVHQSARPAISRLANRLAWPRQALRLMRARGVREAARAAAPAATGATPDRVLQAIVRDGREDG